jgi:hypothetical protein
MEKKILTDAAIRALKPGSERREVRDHGAVGLYLTIQVSGHKSWCLRFRGKDGRPTKMVLGPLDLTGQEMSSDLTVGMPLSLGAARQLANSLHRQRAFGDDIIADHKRQKQKSENTFAAAVHAYLDQHASKTRGAKRTAHVLGVGVKGGLVDLWGTRELDAITANDVFELIADSRTRGVPGIAPKAASSTAQGARWPRTAQSSESPSIRSSCS